MGSLRRGDFWEVKPGKLEELKEIFCEIRTALAHHSDGPVRLLQITHGQGGPANLTAGHCYASADFESGAAYGAYLNSVRSDDSVMKLWAHLHSERTPAIHRGTGLLQRFHADGQPPEQAIGSVSLVRAWKIAPGMEPVTQAAGQLIQQHASRYGGYLQVLRPMIAPSQGPNVITSTTFADWTKLGPFLDELNDDEGIQQATAPFRSATPPAQLYQAHIAAVIAN
jgi:hypothetical protein